MKHLYESVFSGALMALLVATPFSSHAQTPQAPTQAEAQAALNQAPSQLSNAQIDQMVAPIALYPDQLLTQVLMASTFPDQLVDAQKWLQDSNNASLKGDDLANALQPLPWDPSVKSLVAFPQIIAMMINHLDWTQALGTAFANQEVLVFSRVQFLRERAKQAGFLKTTSQIAVTTEESDIIIAPANPDEIYVPVYNPADVYGAWPDNDYPPVYIPPPPNFYSGPIGAGIGFSVGFGVVAPLWGWGHPDWRNHSVAIDPGRYQHITTENYIRENHINIEGGAWHRSGPVAFVPEAQRPRPTYQGGEAPKGTVQPSAVFHPGAAGPRPAGEAGRPNQAAPGPHPAGEAQPGGPHPAGEAAPGPRPAGEAQPGGPHPEEHAAPGPHPAGQAQPGAHPEEHAAPQGAPPHPEEHAAPQAAPPHPEEHAAPQGGAPHPEEARPQEAPHPEEHAAPQAAPPHPEEHAAPPHPEEHAAPQAAPPHPEEHAAPEHAAPPAPHPEEHAAPAPHPAAPPHPAPQAHPAPQKAPAKPGEEHKDDQH